MIFSPHIGMVFDCLIMLLLIITIFYCMRLSRLYKVFSQLKDDKQDIEVLIQQLSKIIDTANQAIQDMKDAAREDGTDLQKHIDEAHTLSDELEIILTSGNNLATRLQKLVEQVGSQKDAEKQNAPSETAEAEIDDDEDEMDALITKKKAAKAPAKKPPKAAKKTAKKTTKKKPKSKSDTERMILDALGGGKGK